MKKISLAFFILYSAGRRHVIMKYSFIENHSVEPEIVTISYVLTKSITFLVLFNKSFPVVERGSIGIYRFIL